MHHMKPLQQIKLLQTIAPLEISISKTSAPLRPLQANVLFEISTKI